MIGNRRVALLPLLVWVCSIVGACSGSGTGAQTTAPETRSAPVGSEPTAPETRSAPVGTGPDLPETTAASVGTGPDGDDASPDQDAGTLVTVAEAQPTATTDPASAAEPAPVETAGGQSIGPLGDTQLDVQTDEGTVQIGGGSIPEAASGFPVPDDLVVLLVSETSSDAGFSGESEMSVDDLAAFYEDALADTGFTIMSSNVRPGVVAVFNFEGATTVGQVAVSSSSSGDGSSIIVALSDGQGDEESVPD